MSNESSQNIESSSLDPKEGKESSLAREFLVFLGAFATIAGLLILVLAIVSAALTVLL